MSKNVEIKMIPLKELNGMLFESMGRDANNELLINYKMGDPASLLPYFINYGIENFTSIDTYIDLPENKFTNYTNLTPAQQLGWELAKIVELRDHPTDKFTQDISFIEWNLPYISFSNDVLYDCFEESFKDHYGISPYNLGLDEPESILFADIVCGYERVIKNIYRDMEMSNLRAMQDLFTVTLFEDKLVLTIMRSPEVLKDLLLAVVEEVDYENFIDGNGNVITSKL